MNERALGFCTRMLVPLVMYPTDARWSWPANARFTPAEEWLGKKLHPKAVPGELVTGICRRSAPRHPADFQTWSGLPKAKAVVRQPRARNVSPTSNGKTLYDVPDAPRPDPDTAAPVRFLPEFDNLLLAHAKRERIIADEHRPAVFTKNLRVKATYTVDGLRRRAVDGGEEAWCGHSHADPVRPDAEAGRRPSWSAKATALLGFLEPDAKTYEVVTAS